MRFALLLLTLFAPAQAAPDGGRGAYLRYCATCHGVGGEGDGPTARWLEPPPRAFTQGAYRWRSTPSGAPPTAADLLRTIDDGVRGTSMPAWKSRLPLAIREALVMYLRETFPEGFDPEDVEPAIAIPTPPASTPELVARGAKVYEASGCASCHGSDGRGDGESVPTLKDDQGRPLSPGDFARPLKVGDTPEAVYRILVTGMDGTPMPSFADTLTADDRWPLVHYVLSLRDRGALDYFFAPLEEQP